MKKIIGLGAIALLMLASCTKNEVKPEAMEHILESKILSVEDQAKLTPASVIETLKKGNQEFVEDRLTIRNNPQRISSAASGQYPMAVILSCLDSRVPVEDVFHSGIGDLFVARVAGNVVNEDILGSLEYACKVSGSKVLVVLGHEKCGAVSSAVKDVKLGNITHLLSKITPSVQKVSTTFEGPKDYSNTEFVEAVCSENVHASIEQIRAQSPILKEMEEKGEIMIVGGMYNINTGAVEFYQ